MSNDTFQLATGLTSAGDITNQTMGIEGLHHPKQSYEMDDSFTFPNDTDTWLAMIFGSNVSSAGVNTTATPNKTIHVMTPYSTEHLIVTSTLLGLFILATIIGNILVIAAIKFEKNLQGVANYLIMSLAFTDLAVTLFVMPLAVVNEVSEVWFLGQEVCDVFISMDVLLCTASILHLVAIALDRYWAVTRIDYIRNRTAKRIKIMIAVVWVISVCISIPPLFGWKDPKYDTEKIGACIISQDQLYTVFSTGGAFYLPFIVMMVIYYKIWRTARSRIRKKGFRPKSLSTYRDDDNSTMTEGVTVVTYLPGPNANLLKKQNGQNHRTSGDSLGEKDSSTNGSVNQDSNGNVRGPVSPASTTSSPTKSESMELPDPKMCKLVIKKSPKENKRDKLELKRERKAARTLAIITGCFCGCWFPFFVLALLFPFCHETCHVPPSLRSFLTWLGYSNSLLNPIIYTIFSPDFRNAFRKILLGKFMRHRQSISR